MPEFTEESDWLRTEDVEPSPRSGSGHVDFAVGAALVGVNLFVSGGLLAILLVDAVGAIAEIFSSQTPGIETVSVIESANAFTIMLVGSSLGLALGLGGFAWFAWKRWPSYYWPLLGIALTVGSAVIATRS